jgi:hypothetical protein
MPFPANESKPYRPGTLVPGRSYAAAAINNNRITTVVNAHDYINKRILYS